MLQLAGRPPLELAGAELLLNPLQKLPCWVPAVLCVSYGINSVALGVTVLRTTSCRTTEDSASSDGKQPFYIQQPAMRQKEGTGCVISAEHLPVCLLSFSAVGHTLTQHLCLVLAQQCCQRCQQQAPEAVPLVPAKDTGPAKAGSISSPDVNHGWAQR